MTIGFIIAALLAVAGAIAAMTLRNLVHCALALAGTFSSLAVVYLSLDAQFIGFAQLLVYVGAVAILIVFVILLTGHEESRQGRWSQGWGWSLGAAVALLLLLCRGVLQEPTTSAPATTAPDLTVRALGDQLMGRYVLPLEIIGVLLTAALIGAVVLALREKEEP